MATGEVVVGYNVLVSFNGAIAAQRGASVKFNGDVIDVATKDSEWWKEFIAGLKDWTVDCNGLYAVTGGAGAALAGEFLNQGGTPPSVTITVQDSQTSLMLIEGSAIIKSIDIAAAYTEGSTFTAAFQGSGKPTVLLGLS